ncbi:zinc finger protein, putative [Plasmodium malariae]|uniref:Zinc finger protein, putative n=1 Tax=Plasmodium malariae TaxID=5858 RepID=A0A1A8VT15_PLAMA|nr:zinc finger protein, putative [Plasmodium malariae]SBS83616.1 zinc finger protein, putative [Plasmodium malariae]SBT87721.1 zinc finger protein, putative [Plasmodium malariae]
MNNKKNFSKYMDKKIYVNVPKERMNEEFRNVRKEENLSNVVNTSERRILFYKTKICPWYIKGKCERRKTCLYAHAQNELRELPNLCKTSLCPKLKINESCNDKKCKYAHTNIELRATENLYKTALCESFIKGKCFSGQFCRYAHGQNELRENPMEITDKNIIIGTSKMKNEKLDYEKKKSVNSSCSSINNFDNSRRNETYCFLPKKKEMHFNKNNNNALTDIDGICDITETIDSQVQNDSTTDISYDYNRKGGDYILRNGSSNSCSSNSNSNKTAATITAATTAPASSATNTAVTIAATIATAASTNTASTSSAVAATTSNSSLISNSHNVNNINNSRMMSKRSDIFDYHKKGQRNQKYNIKGCANIVNRIPTCDNNSSSIDNNNHITVSSHVGNFFKQEDISKFNDEQFLSDNLNVLGFLEDHTTNNNSIEKFVKGNNNSMTMAVNDVLMNSTSSFPNNTIICGSTSSSSSSSSYMKYSRNENNNRSNNNNSNSNRSGGVINSSNSSSSLANFNISSLLGTNVDMHSNSNITPEENYYSFNVNNMEKINYEDFFFSGTTNNDDVVNNDNSDNIINNNDDVTYRSQLLLCKYMSIKDLKNNGERYESMSSDISRNVNGTNNMVNDCVQGSMNNKLRRDSENSDSLASWENFSLLGKTKTFNPGKDYFKIFNYGMCNNYDKKLFENCNVHKSKMDKVDKSLFIL